MCLPAGAIQQHSCAGGACESPQSWASVQGGWFCWALPLPVAWEQAVPSVTHSNCIGCHRTFVFCFTNILDAGEVKESQWDTGVVHLPILIPCSQKHVQSDLISRMSPTSNSLGPTQVVHRKVSVVKPRRHFRPDSSFMLIPQHDTKCLGQQIKERTLSLL